MRMISGYEIANVFLLVYAGLFPIINPIGGAPIFLGLTRHCTDKERNALALRVTINSFFLLLGSLLAGSYVLEFFGITLPIVRVAGGLLVTATAWSLLQAGDDQDDRADRKSRTPADAFYPAYHANHGRPRLDRGSDHARQPAPARLAICLT